MKKSIPFFLACTLGAGVVTGQSMQLVSGNGQIVSEQFVSTVPFVVRALDASGRPAPAVPVSWSLKQGEGTIAVGASTQTDANGLASASFLATSLFSGASFVQSVVGAVASTGNVDFVITTAALRTLSGGQASPPFINLEQPTTFAVSGPAGSVIRGGLQVRVVASTGFQAGQGVPFIGVRIAPVDPSLGAPSAVCSGAGGVVLTNDQGLAVCDLVLSGNAGVSQFTGVVGEIQNTPRVTLTITPSQTCTYSISPTLANLGSAGGAGSISITTASGCAWTAASNANWLTITVGGSGTGNGTLQFTAAANNTGAARSGTLTIAGNIFTVTESASSSVPPATGALAFVTGTALPGATAGLPYSAALNVSGGTAPYIFQAITPFPPGLGLNRNTGAITGAVPTAGNYTFSVSATDAANLSVTQTLTLSVTNPANGTAFQITTSSLPGGTAGVGYSQPISTANACAYPFSGSPLLAVLIGSLPPGITFQGASLGGTPTTPGTFAFTLRATDACGNIATRDLSITIGGSSTIPPPVSTTLAASPSAITFSSVVGGPVPATQRLTLTSGQGVVAFSAVVAGASWLGVNPAAGSTPGSLDLSVNPTGLLPGIYSGSVVVTTSNSGTLTVPVTLTISAGAALTVSPLGLSIDSSTATVPRTLTISSNPSGLAFTVTAATITGGNWLLFTPFNGSTPSTLAITANPAGLPAGSYSGVITVIPTANPGASVVVPVTLTVNDAATLTAAPAVLNFLAVPGVVTSPMIVTLGSSGAPVRYTTTANVPWLLVTPQTGATPATLLVAVNSALLQPGVNLGVLTITPDTARAPVTIAVTATLDNSVAEVTAVVNAASFAPGPVAPGEIITLFGTNLSPTGITTSKVGADGRLETAVAGVRVLFDDIAAPIIYVSPTQVSAIVPYQVYGRTSARVQLERASSRTTAREVRVTDAAPAIFKAANGQDAAINQDGSLNSAGSGAEPGSVISVFGTGEGQTNLPGINGRITPAILSELASPLLPVTAQVGGQTAEVLYAGSAPGQTAGAMQVNIRIPPGAARGPAVPLLITVGGFSSQPGVTLAIK